MMTNNLRLYNLMYNMRSVPLLPSIISSFIRVILPLLPINLNILVVSKSLLVDFPTSYSRFCFFNYDHPQKKNCIRWFSWQKITFSLLLILVSIFLPFTLPTTRTTNYSRIILTKKNINEGSGRVIFFRLNIVAATVKQSERCYRGIGFYISFFFQTDKKSNKNDPKIRNFFIPHQINFIYEISPRFYYCI